MHYIHCRPYSAEGDKSALEAQPYRVKVNFTRLPLTSLRFSKSTSLVTFLPSSHNKRRLVNQRTATLRDVATIWDQQTTRPSLMNRKWLEHYWLHAFNHRQYLRRARGTYYLPGTPQPFLWPLPIIETPLHKAKSKSEPLRPLTGAFWLPTRSQAQSRLDSRQLTLNHNV